MSVSCTLDGRELMAQKGVKTEDTHTHAYTHKIVSTDAGRQKNRGVKFSPIYTGPMLTNRHTLCIQAAKKTQKSHPAPYKAAAYY